jgi:hypothetical protein
MRDQRCGSRGTSAVEIFWNMPAVRRLGRPPISEALVDFRVRREKPFAAEESRKLLAEIGADYQVDERREVRSTSLPALADTRAESRLP